MNGEERRDKEEKCVPLNICTYEYEKIKPKVDKLATTEFQYSSKIKCLLIVNKANIGSTATPKNSLASLTHREKTRKKQDYVIRDPSLFSSFYLYNPSHHTTSLYYRALNSTERNNH